MSTEEKERQMRYEHRYWCQVMEQRESEYQLSEMRAETEAEEQKVREWAKKWEENKAERKRQEALHGEVKVVKHQQESPPRDRAQVPIRKDILMRAAQKKKEEKKH